MRYHSYHDYFARHQARASNVYFPDPARCNFDFDARCDFYDHEFCYRIHTWGDHGGFLINAGYIRHVDLCFNGLAAAGFSFISPSGLFKRAYRHMKQRGDYRLCPAFVIDALGSGADIEEEEARWLDERSLRINGFDHGENGDF